MEWRSSALFMTGPEDLCASYGAFYVHKCIASTYIGQIGAIHTLIIIKLGTSPSSRLFMTAILETILEAHLVRLQ